MKIVKKNLVVLILLVLLGSNYLQAQCTCTESPGSLNANQLVLCENFESYSNGSSFPFNNARWTFWPGTGTSARIQTAPISSSKALLVQNNGFSSPDLLLKLGNRTTGRYRLSWQMYIPKGKTAQYSIQHAESAERWAYEVDFENGIGTLSRFGLPVTKFPYIIGGWNKVMQIIDITSDQVELWINDEYVDSWRYNTGRAPDFSYIFGTYPLAAINFKGATNASYYVDNICMWQATPALSTNVGPTCIKNGQSISGGESIIKNYNLYTEREYSNENCRNICSFAGLNVRNSLKYDDQNRVPASRIDDASILPNQVINLPCLKDRILTQKSLRGQIYPFTATTTDLSIELQFQVGFAGNVQIALVECNENLNFPCQLDENTDGQSFYFKVQPGKTYNIIVIATETVEFLIDISTIIRPKICVLANQDIGTPCICKDATSTLTQATSLSNVPTSSLSATKRVFPEINRDYLGGEKAFRIILERPSLVNFSLRSTNQGYSMFLAGSDCADNLLALNSTPDNGGTATISKALEAGVYHLVVDQLRENSTSTFQLTYTFSVLDPVSRASNSSCPTNPNNVHQVSIRSSPLLLNTDVLTIKDRIYLVNTRNSNNREASAINWNGQEINFTLQEDASSDNLNCGYVDGDLIEFVIIRQDKIYSVKPIFQLENGTDITASNQFKKGGKSLITGFVSNLNVSNLGVGSIPTLSANERTFDVEVNSTGAWRIQRANPNKTAWIEFSLTSSSGIKDVSFKVLRNQNTQSRTDTVLVINDQGFYKSIVIEQPGCTGPSVNAGADRSICSGQNLTLTATGNGTITWQAPGPVSNPNLTTTLNATQTFTAYATINGCSAADQVTVNVSPKPNADAGPDQTICSGSKTVLSASGGGAYTWSTGSTAAQFEVSPTATTTYTLTVTTQSGCTASDQVVVVVNRATASAGTDRSICRGDSTTLQASGGGTYLWSNGKTDRAMTVSPTSDQVYQVTVSNNNCSATASVRVTVNPLPLANAGADTSICAGRSAMLTASGGSTYKWSNNAKLSSITVTPASTETFTVTVTAQNGCEASDQLTVTVRPLPNANAGPDQSICAGQSALLTASGGSGYKWNTNATASSITVVPGNTETFTVTVTQNGCEATDQLTVTVRPLPVANAGPDQSICAGQSAVLTASGGSSYKWNNNASSSSISVVPGNTTTYTVTVTQNGCEATDQLTVTVRPLPTATAGPDQSICAGQSAVLTASGGSGYKWNTNATASTITVTPGSTETFTVTVTQNGCEATDQLTVTVRPLPVANAGPDQSICAGQSAVLTASGGGTYKWNTNTTASSITVLPSNTETFTVTVTQSGCEATDQLTVTVRSLPTANAGPDQSICAGQSAQLTASGGSSYKWSNNATASSITVVPGSTETFTVTVTQSGCEATDQLTVTVRPLPVANAGPDQSICAGQSAVLTASGGGSYKWNTNATASSITVVPGNTETFTVTVTQNGCEATDQLTVTVRPLPVANAGPDQSICAGQSAVLTASGGGSYKWNNNASSSSVTVTPGNTTTYTVTVTQNGCEATDQLTVTVRPLPIANAGPDQSICAGQSAVLTASGGGSYKWNTNATASSITVVLGNTETFTVTVTQNGCEASDQLNVTVRPLPIANAGPDLSICAKESAVLNATGGNSYKWSNNATTASITISPAATQVFTVTVTQNECQSADEVRVTVRPLPNANAGPDQSICAGQSTVLNATGEGTYKWSNNATTANISVSPAATQSYSLTVTQNDCEAIDQVTINVNPNPSIKKDSSQFKAGLNSFISVSVTGGKGPYQYQWFRNDTLTSTQEDLVGLKTGIYKLSIQDANGCSAGYGPELFIITSSRDAAGLLDLKVYPNPTHGQFRIEGKLSKKETVQVRILEASGKYIWKSDVKTANEFLYTPDLSNLAKGIYIIQLNVSGDLVYRKFILH